MTAANPTRLFVSGTLSFVLIGALPALYGVSLPAYRRLFDLSEGQGGQLLSAHGIGAFIYVFAGIFGLRWLTTRFALAALAVGGALVAAQPGWVGVLVGAFALGAGFGLISTIQNRRFLAEFGDRGPGMVGLLNAVFGIGAIAAPILFVWAGGAPAPVFAGIALGSAMLIPVVQPSGKGPATIGLPEWRNRRSLILILLFASVLLEVGLFGFGPSALITLGTPELAAARLASVFFVVFLLARLGLYWLTNWISAQVLFLCGICGIALCGILAAAGWPALAYVLAGGCTGLTFPSFFVWGSAMLGRDPRIASLMLAAALSALATGPLILGLVLARFGIGSLFVVLGILAAVAAIALCLTILQLWRPVPDRAPPNA